jgi:hypothetical protein
MQVIGFNLSKVSVEREEKQEGKLSISQNMGIDNIDKEIVSFSKEEVFKIKFNYSVNYNEGKFGKVELKGSILIIPKKDEQKKLENSWKDKKLPDEFKIPLFNFIKSKCDIKALSLEDDMSLPLHIPFPKLAIKPKDKSN